MQMDPIEHSADNHSPGAESISDRLQRATADFKILEQLILCGDFSPGLLSEFRYAVDSIRGTARVVQMWAGLQERDGDRYSAMSTMAEDRVQRAIQITKNLTVDLESTEADFETEALVELYRTILELQDRLSHLLPDVNADASFAKFKARSDRTNSEKKKYG